MKLDLEKVKGTEFESSYTFKITQDMKDEFVDLCNKNDWSTGKVMRELVGSFLKEYGSKK